MGAETRDDNIADRPQLSLIEQVLSLSELCAHLHVSAQTIYDLRSQGRGPRGIRVGRELRFRVSEVEAWLTRMENDDDRHHVGRGCDGRPTKNPHRNLRERQRASLRQAGHR